MQIRIECGPIGQRQNLACVRILDNHGAGNRLRVMNRLIEFLLSDVLNIFVNSQDEVVSRVGLSLDIREPLAAGVDGDKHLSRAAAQFVIELVLDAALS